MQIENLTINYLREQYEAKKFTPLELMQHLIHKADQFAEKNIWIHRLRLEDVETSINQLDRENFSDQPLWGIPFVVKDNFDVAGLPTTAACEAFTYTADSNAYVVQKLLDAGAILLGKANMDQFATGLVGVRSPEKWGACKNSFNSDYVSGGSSSGSAVAVALGLASFSLGTDTAGSGRVPAALNNIIGLKPSKGLLSFSGVVPACRTLDCVSIFSTTTDDANTVFETACGFDQQDPYGRKNIDTNRKNYGRYQGDFSFAVPAQQQLNFFGDQSAQKQFATAVESLEALGGKKIICDFEPLFAAAKLLYSGPWVAERYVAAEDIYLNHPDSLLPVIKEILSSQLDASAADTFKAIYQLQAYKQLADQLFDIVDILVTPTAGTIYTQAELAEQPIALNSNLGYYTNYLNLLDYSAIAMPAGFLDNKLPFGISFIGKCFDDTKLLSLANRWQQYQPAKIGATDWSVPAQSGSVTGVLNTIDVAVCGAHLEGLPLNWQLLEREGKLLRKDKTADNYRFYALAGGPPYRPGLIRDEQQGASIDVEVWRLPTAFFGSFVAGIPKPLGIGKVELADGNWITSFICETYGIEGAEDITKHGSWRNYISSL